jgi:hypothetical protein
LTGEDDGGAALCGRRNSDHASRRAASMWIATTNVPIAPDAQLGAG